MVGIKISVLRKRVYKQSFKEGPRRILFVLSWAFCDEQSLHSKSDDICQTSRAVFAFILTCK